MSSELREAANRRRTGDYSKVHGIQKRSLQPGVDAELLADAWLRDNPAESDELVDEAYLRTVKWVVIGNTWYPPEESLPNGYQGSDPLIFWVRVDGTVRIGKADWMSQPDVTRCQFRRLCAALGITLTETSNDN